MCSNGNDKIDSHVNGWLNTNQKFTSCEIYHVFTVYSKAIFFTKKYDCLFNISQSGLLVPVQYDSRITVIQKKV